MILYILIIIFLSGYIYIKNRHQYWIRRKVPYLNPKNLILGNTGEIFFNDVPFFKYHAKIYNSFPYFDKFGGYYNFLNPVLIVRDPELIKNVLTKDFLHFMNRGSAFIDENDALTLHIFNLTGDRWRILRHKLTPTFTSGRIKVMFNLMKECALDLVNLIDNEIIDENESFEIKDVMARFTTDIISTCVFGLESNSLKNPDSLFRKMGKKVFAPSFRSRFTGFFSSALPGLRRFLKLSFFDKDMKDFFESIVINTVKYREENNVQRNDFIDLLIALRNETKNTDTSTQSTEEEKFELTDKLMIAQCFVFFVAGFETSSGTLTFALYELAKNQDIQRKLFEEIDDVLNKYDNEITYECLHEMTYLDQIVSETLRHYPILPFLVRRCNKEYKLSEEYTVDIGTRVIISVLGLHLDPKYYDNPEKFDPEHFSKEAKSKRHHYTYLPFGEGPRVCIGMRFGLTQVKLGLIVLIRNYKINLARTMESTLKFSKSSFLANIDGGVWLTFKRRSSFV